MQTVKTTLNVQGMSCHHCVMAIEKAVSGLTGVKAVKVDLAGKTVNVEFDPGEISVQAINNTIMEEGYAVV